MSEENVETIRQPLETKLGAKVEAAGGFQRESARDDPVVDFELFGFVFDFFDRLSSGHRQGTAGRLPHRFLLAVTSDKVHVFTLRRRSSNEAGDEVATFERDQVRLRRTAGGNFIYLSVIEGGRTNEIALNGSVLDKYPGAAEVLAALSE